MGWIWYFLLFCVSLLLAVFLSGFFTKKSECSYLDKTHSSMVKGLAILFVVLCHYMGSFGGGVRWFTPLGGVGVAVFLLLSGYGLNESYKKTQVYGFWRKRFLAVFLPYIIVEAATLWTHPGISFTDVLLDFLLLKPLYVNGWYLTYLLFWYAAFYLTVRIPFLRHYKLWFFAVLSVAIFFTQKNLLAEQSFSFLFGVWLSDMREKKYFPTVSKCFVTLGLLFVSLCCLALKQVPAVRNTDIPFVLSFVDLMIKLPFGFALCNLVFYIRKYGITGFLALVGTVSYELYIVHGVALTFFQSGYVQADAFLLLSAATSVLLWSVVRLASPIGKKLLRLK